MIAPEEIQRNYPKLVQWITQRQEICLAIGERLSFEATRDAQTIGIGQIEEVRIMVEGKIRFLLTQSYCSFFLKADLAPSTASLADMLFSSCPMPIADTQSPTNLCMCSNMKDSGELNRT